MGFRSQRLKTRPPAGLALIVAMTPGRVIGRAGTLPWRLRADLRRFRRLTMGHHVIMGRKTYESLPGPLPGRHMVVLASRPCASVPETLRVGSWEDVWDRVQGDDSPFVIGGSRVFREALPWCQTMYLTLVHGTPDGDVRFPPIDWTEWTLRDDAWQPADEANEFPVSFRCYVRRRPGC